MIMVQKFHSIHEIDPEFIANIEVLLQEDVASFDTLIQRHDSSPKTDTFTYFLFFGPTQNAPIGLAQLCLRQVPFDQLLPWYKKLKFWDKDHEHWKQITWQVGDGSPGMCVFDPRFSRTCKEKLLELIKEYESRPDVVAQYFYHLKGLQDFQCTLNVPPKMTKESYVLEPMMKSSKTYEDYLRTLKPDVQKMIKGSWKNLHSSRQVELGDYPTPKETPKTLPIPEGQLNVWEKWGAQVLTFEKDLKVLGCLLVLKGKNGNVFFEPIPFEPEGEAIVNDELYTQYALLKFFEMPEARKCHLMKFGAKLVFDSKEDLEFFEAQNFQSKTITRQFYSKLSELLLPV